MLCGLAQGRTQLLSLAHKNAAVSASTVADMCGWPLLCHDNHHHHQFNDAAWFVQPMTAAAIGDIVPLISVYFLLACLLAAIAGIIAIDLARQMLQLLPNTYVLVVSTENITQNWYFGNTKSMLIPNCLFRVGGAAMLLSNKRRESW